MNYELICIPVIALLICRKCVRDGRGPDARGDERPSHDARAARGGEGQDPARGMD